MYDKEKPGANGNSRPGYDYSQQGNYSKTDSQMQFMDAMRAAGIKPPVYINADGQLHRFSTNSKKNDDAGWYVLFDDTIPAGAYGDWRSGVNEKWCSKTGQTFMQQEKAAHRRRMDEIKKAQQAEQKRQHEKAASKAETILKAAKAVAPGHPYIVKKQIEPTYSLREMMVEELSRHIGYHPKAKGNPLQGQILIVPLYIDDDLSTVEFIDVEGRKCAMAGGKKKGAYWTAGLLPDGDGKGETILIGEGVATVLSARQATGFDVVAASSCHNLEPVALTMRKQYPEADIVVLADIGNGQAQAEKAARTANARLALPDFGRDQQKSQSDFNDLYITCGPDEVRRQIKQAQQPEKKTPLVIRCMADIESKPIDWFWPGKIARGKTTMIAGNPGLGKSQLTIWLAAKASKGGGWPNIGGKAPMGSVLIISGEDSASDTIKPRLMAVGASLDKIHIIDGIPEKATNGKTHTRMFDLSRDIDLLEKQLEQSPEIILVIIDPISAYLGNTDSHKNADVRALLAPLSSLAEKHNAAIVLVSHLNKSGGEAISRVNGSGAFVAAVRAAYIVANEIIDGRDTGRRLFVPAKNNIAPDNYGLAFKVKSHKLESGIETSRIEWQSGTISKTADEVLAAIHTVGANDSPKRQEAETFLEEILSECPMTSKQIKRLTGEAGISWRTIERAKNKLHIEAKRNGFGKDAFYEWHLPQTEGKNTMDRQPPNGGGPCSNNAAKSPTDGGLPMHRQTAAKDSMAAHETPKQKERPKDEQKNDCDPAHGKGKA